MCVYMSDQHKSTHTGEVSQSLANSLQTARDVVYYLCQVIGHKASYATL